MSLRVPPPCRFFSYPSSSQSMNPQRDYHVHTNLDSLEDWILKGHELSDDRTLTYSRIVVSKDTNEKRTHLTPGILDTEVNMANNTHCSATWGNDIIITGQVWTDGTVGEL